MWQQEKSVEQSRKWVLEKKKNETLKKKENETLKKKEIGGEPQPATPRHTSR